MRAYVLALVPIAFAQPAFAHSHSHRHAAHHSSRHHHYADHHRHHHVRQHTPHYGSWRQDEGMRQTPQAFARTDAWESGWQQSASTQQQSWSSNAQRRGWQQNAASQRYEPPGFEQSGTSLAFEQGVRRTERSSARASNGELDAMIARHAAANGLPVELVHRVVKRESGYNPRARNASGATGLMQIMPATARGMGYTGSTSGLLDAETNMTYAVKYLAGAYKAAGGNANRAVAYYQSGYHGRGTAVAVRREQPTFAAQQPASNWGGQSWDMQTERVAMNGTDVTAVRAGQGRRWRHRR
jgi:hypothetical protein